MSFSIKHVKEIQNEFQSVIHRDESDLAYTLLADVWGCFSAEETQSCTYTGIFAGLPVLTGFIFYMHSFS